MRLDQAAAQLFGEYSRERLKDWIKDGRLTLDGRPGKPRDRVAGGQTLVLAAELDVETRHRRRTSRSMSSTRTPTCW